MHLLLADAQPKSRSLLSTVLSVALHGAAIVVLALSGQRVVNAVTDLIQQTVQYLYPPPRELGLPGQGQANVGALSTPRASGSQMPSWKDRTVGVGSAVGSAQNGAEFAPYPTATEVAEPGVEDNAFSVVEVDTLASVDPTSAAPEYPKALAQRKVEGMAAFRFVIDSTGRVDMGTVRVLSSTHKLFVQAVISAMPRMKYRPASVGGRRVRLLVDQSFMFMIQKPKAQIS